MDDSQRVAAKIALAVLAADGFILAGGQALIEHGITWAVESVDDGTETTEPGFSFAWTKAHVLVQVQWRAEYN